MEINAPVPIAFRGHGSRDVAGTSSLQDDRTVSMMMRSLTSLSNPREAVLSNASRASQVISSDIPEQEGGIWGWTVVMGSSIIFFVTLGLIYSFGVLQAELIARHYSTASTLGWVSSTTVVLAPLLAVPITHLIRSTSNRFVGFLGALCTGLGYIATSYTFSSPIVYLFLAQSLFGLGYAFNFWACNSLAGEYFVKKRGLAVGIVYAGSGLGGAVFSIGLSKLITDVGLEWGVRLAGIIALALLIPASFSLRKRKELPISRLRFAYFKQLNFILLVLSTGLMTFSLFVPPFYIPSYAISAGMSPKTGSYLVAGYNLASFVGRILFGFLADSRVGPLTSLCLAMLLMATSILSIWIASSGLLAPLIIFLLINGSASGALLSLQTPTLAALYGLAEMASTMSMVTMSRAAGSALGAPLAGILLDKFGGTNSGVKPYLIPFLVIGLISLVSAFCLLALRFRLAGISLKKKI